MDKISLLRDKRNWDLRSIMSILSNFRVGEVTVRLKLSSPMGLWAKEVLGLVLDDPQNLYFLKLNTKLYKLSPGYKDVILTSR